MPKLLPLGARTAEGAPQPKSTLQGLFLTSINNVRKSQKEAAESEYSRRWHKLWNENDKKEKERSAAREISKEARKKELLATPKEELTEIDHTVCSGRSEDKINPANDHILLVFNDGTRQILSDSEGYMKNEDSYMSRVLYFHIIPPTAKCYISEKVYTDFLLESFNNHLDRVEHRSKEFSIRVEPGPDATKLDWYLRAVDAFSRKDFDKLVAKGLIKRGNYHAFDTDKPDDYRIYERKLAGGSRKRRRQKRKTRKRRH